MVEEEVGGGEGMIEAGVEPTGRVRRERDRCQGSVGCLD